MPVPAAKVRAVCTKAEADLVRASRKPQLDQSTPAQVKKNAAQARKLVDKWRGQKRSQARSRSQTEGFGAADANSKLKVQIFRDALENYEAKLKQLDKAGMKAKKAAGKTKAKRAASHRAGRADVRLDLKQTKLQMRADAAAKARSKAKMNTKAAPAPVAAPVPATPVPAAPPSELPSEETRVEPPRTSKPPVPAAPAGPPKKKAGLKVTKAQQREALTAAKQSRIARTGRTTRFVGHISSRGRRAQGRRDSMNG